MKNSIVKIVSIIMALSLVMLTFAACNDEPNYEPDENQTTESTTESTTEAPPANLNPLTGKADLSDSAIGARPIAIMIENSPSARPQWGMSTPDVIIEGLVEGGITRMMWLYADAEDIPDKVGPTRSARHDFVEIAAGLNAIYVHWGGSGRTDSTLAYGAIKNYDIDNIDGMTYSGTYFFRDQTRNVSSEHRGYTTGSSIQKAISKLGYETKAEDNKWMPFKVLVDGQRMPYGDASGNCSSITFTYSSGYKRTFKYDAENKTYDVYMNSTLCKDGSTSETVSVDNVIIMYCGTSTIDSKGHQEWDLTSGDAVFVSNGYGESISWKKDGKTSALKFYGKDGQELTINKGQTFIGVVPEKNRGLTTITE